MIRFSRLGLFLSGLAILLILFYLQRLFVYKHSQFTYGIVIYDQAVEDEENEVEMDLYYYIGMNAYHKKVMENTSLANQNVVVRYFPQKPYKGKIYTPARFWLVDALWMLFPLMLWTAFVFTLLNEDMKLEIDWREHL
ncbi:MAG: hypothetical protein IJT04_03650 [Bacteroidales bacterium]|nr:hypothetical protein [Bacteroidales bacterium]